MCIQPNIKLFLYEKRTQAIFKGNGDSSLVSSNLKKDTMWTWKKISCWDRQQHPSYLPGQAAYLLWMTEKNRYYSRLTCQRAGTSVHVHKEKAETSRHGAWPFRGVLGSCAHGTSGRHSHPAALRFCSPCGSLAKLWLCAPYQVDVWLQGHLERWH